jgi:hypothetical protein
MAPWTVTPAQAGVQGLGEMPLTWMPVFAGMTAG